MLSPSAPRGVVVSPTRRARPVPTWTIEQLASLRASLLGPSRHHHRRRPRSPSAARQPAVRASAQPRPSAGVDTRTTAPRRTEETVQTPPSLPPSSRLLPFTPDTAAVLLNGSLGPVTVAISVFGSYDAYIGSSSNQFEPLLRQAQNGQVEVTLMAGTAGSPPWVVLVPDRATGSASSRSVPDDGPISISEGLRFLAALLMSDAVDVTLAHSAVLYRLLLGTLGLRPLCVQPGTDQPRRASFWPRRVQDVWAAAAVVRHDFSPTVSGLLCAFGSEGVASNLSVAAAEASLGAPPGPLLTAARPALPALLSLRSVSAALADAASRLGATGAVRMDTVAVFMTEALAHSGMPFNLSVAEECGATLAEELSGVERRVVEVVRGLITRRSQGRRSSTPAARVASETGRGRADSPSSLMDEVHSSTVHSVELANRLLSGKGDAAQALADVLAVSVSSTDATGAVLSKSDRVMPFRDRVRLLVHQNHPLGFLLSEHIKLQDRYRRATGFVRTARDAMVPRRHDQAAAATTSTTHMTLHPHYEFLSHTTGRIFTSRPNVQTLAKPPNVTTSDRDIERRNDVSGRPPVGGLRTAFVAPLGTVLVAADYRQMELRILAMLSRDEALLQLLAQGGDVISSIALRLRGHPSSDGTTHPAKAASSVSTTERDAAKVIVYGLLYGLGDHALQARINAAGTARLVDPSAGVDGEATDGDSDDSADQSGRRGPTSAAELRHHFLTLFPGVGRWLDRVKDSAVNTGRAEAISGRWLQDSSLLIDGRQGVGLPPLMEEGNDRSAFARRAVSLHVQGTAADVLKCALAAVWPQETPFLSSVGESTAAAPEEGDETSAPVPMGRGTSDVWQNYTVLLPIHDEVLFVVRKEALSAVVAHIRVAMEHTALHHFAEATNTQEAAQRLQSTGHLARLPVAMRAGPSLAELLPLPPAS